MLKMAWTVEHGGQAGGHAPAHHRRGPRAILRPAKVINPKAAITTTIPTEPELLPDKREDHVRADLGHVGALAAGARAGAEEAAGLYGHHGLHYLVARAVGSGPRVQERHESLAPVGGEQHDPDERDECPRRPRAPGPAS